MKQKAGESPCRFVGLLLIALVTSECARDNATAARVPNPSSSGDAGDSVSFQDSGGSINEPDASGDAGDTTVLDGGTVGDASDSGLSAAWPNDKYLSTNDVFLRVQQSDADMLLVNVVDEEYYNLGHIANSLKIPWDILAANLSQIDRTRHVVLYCRRGVRSESAYETLVDNAYPYVWIMEGGIEAWIAAGYPTVAD